ncbi:antitrypsin [Helicoverpa armigera]|uniref:antitrypsin n=1 Tax=Helicoverpa armigera TaxID=29058 RepID=UPI0030830D54
MFRFKYLVILIFSFVILRSRCQVTFNSLNEKLVFTLIKLKPNENVVASELLVRFSLCKLAAVATGDTKEDLMTLLGYKDERSLKPCYTRLRESLKTMTESDLTLINRIFVDYSKEIDPNFINNSTEKFGVQVEQVGFTYPVAALAHINKMISAITYKRIADILDADDIDRKTKMIIVNGAHYKGTWEFPFDYRLTKVKEFRHIDGKVSKVPMMTKMDSFMFVAAGDCKAINLKFGSWRASITIVIPNSAREFPKLIDKISEERPYVYSLVKSMKSKYLNVLIPRFKIRTFVDWSGFLQGLGLYSLFNTNSSDLVGIYKKEYRNQTIGLSKIKQKIFLQIDEMGVARFKPHPHMDLGPPKGSKAPDVPVFIADRPFYFEVTWDFENARYEMFTGVYYGPESNNIIPK